MMNGQHDLLIIWQWFPNCWLSDWFFNWTNWKIELIERLSHWLIVYLSSIYLEFLGFRVSDHRDWWIDGSIDWYFYWLIDWFYWLIDDWLIEFAINQLNCRIEEINIHAIQFLHGCQHPTLALLHQDVHGRYGI